MDIGEEKKTLPAKAEILKRVSSKTEPLSENAADSDMEREDGEKFPEIYTELLLTICEGKFHQIKRMMEAVGKPVIYLKRIAMGPLKLPDDLPKGACRPLTEKELEDLKQAGKNPEKNKMKGERAAAAVGNRKDLLKFRKIQV